MDGTYVRVDIDIAAGERVAWESARRVRMDGERVDCEPHRIPVIVRVFGTACSSRRKAICSLREQSAGRQVEDYLG